MLVFLWGSVITGVRGQAEQQPWSPAQKSAPVWHETRAWQSTNIHKDFTFNKRDERKSLICEHMRKNLNICSLYVPIKPFPRRVNICSRNSQNKTTSRLIIGYNYAARSDERISMIYLCHGKRVALQTWNLLKPMRVSSRCVDQRSLSTAFLNTETVSYGVGYTTRAAVFLPRNIMAIVFSENISLFFFFLQSWSCKKKEKKKSTQSGDGAQALYPDERLKDGTDLSGISWAFGAQCMAATLSGLFPFGSGLRLQAKSSSPNIYHFIQRLEHTDAPEPLLLYTHTLNNSVCTCANRPVPSGITVQLQAMEAKRDNGSL